MSGKKEEHGKAPDSKAFLVKASICIGLKPITPVNSKDDTHVLHYSILVDCNAIKPKFDFSKVRPEDKEKFLETLKRAARSVAILLKKIQCTDLKFNNGKEYEGCNNSSPVLCNIEPLSIEAFEHFQKCIVMSIGHELETVAIHLGPKVHHVSGK